MVKAHPEIVDETTKKIIRSLAKKGLTAEQIWKMTGVKKAIIKRILKDVDNV
jgi:hypothetical protein